MEWQKRIVCTPGVVGGRPRIKGTRLSVALILEFMAAGSSEAELLESYPQLSATDIRACLRYAVQSLEPPITSEIDAWIEGVPFPDTGAAATSNFILDTIEARNDWEGYFWVIDERGVRARPLPD